MLHFTPNKIKADIFKHLHLFHCSPNTVFLCINTNSLSSPCLSLQSEAGNFECSVSALRWVCKEKVSLKYQFWSWEGHMERMASRRYMPAGPLMDISVISGKLDEVYLPHWICVGKWTFYISHSMCTTTDAVLVSSLIVCVCILCRRQPINIRQVCSPAHR